MGKVWTFGGTPREGMRLSRDLSRLLGPAALSLLQHVLGGGDVLARVASLAQEQTQEARVAAVPALDELDGETAADKYASLQRKLSDVREVLPADIVEQVLATWNAPELDAWIDCALGMCVIDGESYHDEMRLTVAEAYVGLWSVLREQAAFV